jgi:hypothetical protein
MVRPVYDRDVDRSVPEGSRGEKAPKPRSDNDNPVTTRSASVDLARCLPSDGGWHGRILRPPLVSAQRTDLVIVLGDLPCGSFV